jgi:hypothetical protein
VVRSQRKKLKSRTTFLMRLWARRDEKGKRATRQMKATVTLRCPAWRVIDALTVDRSW